MEKGPKVGTKSSILLGELQAKEGIYLVFESQ
jgi:hypothetical protein